MGQVLPDELSRRQPPPKLIAALGSLRREDAASLAPFVMPLLTHPEPDVRSEAVNVVFVVWRLSEHRDLARRLFTTDRHEVVRTRAAYALAATSTDETLRDDVQILVNVLLDDRQSLELRRAAYEGLLLLFRRPGFPDSLAQFDPKSDVDWEWIGEIRTLYE